MELKFPHHVTYRADNWTLDEVLLTLQGQRKLIEAAAVTLEELIKGIEIDTVEIRVERIDTGSLFEDFIIVLYSIYQEDIDPAIATKVHDMFGITVPPEYQPVVSAVILLIALYVGRYAFNAIAAKKGQKTTPIHIQGTYNTVLNVVASHLHLTADQVEKALHKTVPPTKRRSLIKSVTSFLRPKPKGQIEAITVEDVAEISQATLDEYPSDAELLEIDETRNIDIPNARLQIRATDRDRTKSGWGAIIVGNKQFKKRLPMDLYPTVNGDELAKLDVVIADIVVEGDTKLDGSFKAKRIHLLNFKKDK